MPKPKPAAAIGKRSPHGDPDLWNLDELRAVAQDLKSIHDRLEVFATSLEEASAGVERRRARRRLAATRKRILSFVGELFTVQLRLQWIGEGLRQEGRTIAESADEMDLDAPEQLIGAIQCVLTDRLAPGVTALCEAAGYGARNGGPEGEAGE